MCSILGGKSPTTMYTQTVEAAGRSTKSSGKKFVNWVKNHKWPVIGGASAITAVAIVSTVLGVKYLGKKDQKNPDEQEEKIDKSKISTDDNLGGNNQKNLGKKGEKIDKKNKKDLDEAESKKKKKKIGEQEKNQNIDKSKTLIENEKIINEGVANCTQDDVEEKDKKQFHKDFEKLKKLLSNEQEFEERFVSAEHTVWNKDKFASNKNEYNDLKGARDKLKINEIISYLHQIIFGKIKLKKFLFANVGLAYTDYISTFEADEFSNLGLGFPEGKVKLEFTPKGEARFTEVTTLLFNFKD